MPYIFKYVQDTQCLEWDRFVCMQSRCDVRQHSAWAQANSLDGIGSFKMVALSGDQIVAGAQAIVLPYKGVGRVGLVYQGPLWDRRDDALQKAFVNEMKHWCRKQKLLYAMVEVPYGDLPLLQTFESFGFYKRKKGLPPDLFYEATLFVDLTRPEAHIFSDFSKTRRRQIRRAQEAAFIFRKGGRHELPWFLSLMIQMVEKKGDQPVVKNIDVLYSLWDELLVSNEVYLWIGEADGNPVCGTFCIGLGDTLSNWLWAWDGSYSDQYISDLSDWTLMLCAKESGYRYFDFVALDPVSAQAIQRGGTIPASIQRRYFFGSTRYKMSFGGEVAVSPGVVVFFRSFLHRWIFERVLCFFMQNKVCQFVLKRLVQLMK